MKVQAKLEGKEATIQQHSSRARLVYDRNVQMIILKFGFNYKMWRTLSEKFGILQHIINIIVTSLEILKESQKQLFFCDKHTWL